MDSGVLWAEQHIRLKRCREGAFIYNINDAFIGRALDKYGEISRGEIIFLCQLIRPGMTVVEVGANIGLLTVPFARLVAPGGKVIAFEPQRIVYQMLCGNLALNAITNAFARNSAIGCGLGSITVPPVDYTKPGNFGGVSLRGWKEGETVPMLTIDSLLLDRCDFMKIDVEGMELDVLQGSAQALERFRPRLYVENDRIKNSPSLIRHLLALDYRLYWHLPLLYNADNYFGDGEDIFPRTVSVNIVAVPRSGPLSIDVRGLIEITSQDARPPGMR